MLSANHTKWQWTLPPSHTTDANPELQQLLLAYTSGDEPTIVQCCEAWFHYMGLVWGRHIIHIGPQEVTVYTGLWLMCMYTLYSPLSLVLYVQIHTYTPPTHHTQSHNRHMTHTHIWIGFMAEFLFRVAFSHRQAVQYIQYCQLSCTNRQQSLAFPEQCN